MHTLYLFNTKYSRLCFIQKKCFIHKSAKIKFFRSVLQFCETSFIQNKMQAPVVKTLKVITLRNWNVFFCFVLLPFFVLFLDLVFSLHNFFFFLLKQMVTARKIWPTARERTKPWIIHRRKKKSIHTLSNADNITELKGFYFNNAL